MPSNYRRFKLKLPSKCIPSQSDSSATCLQRVIDFLESNTVGIVKGPEEPRTVYTISSMETN